MEWETVIGLEVHAQLATKSKLFSGAPTSYGAEPNSQACAIDLGFPGVLPVANKEAFVMATKLGLAIDATVEKHSVFDRKNYFYPDLPKGYQISQLFDPIVSNGKLTFEFKDENNEVQTKTVNIVRAHLEEDAGKSLHEEFTGYSAVDLNRAGIPLIEIVTGPELSNATEAVAYLKKLHALVKCLGICDGNMQEGSFRCDANVSVRPKGQKELGTRCEIKNVNSFRFVEKAINYEIERQIDLIEAGGEVIQQTRLYDSAKNETRAMRSKEEANDYRYFPDPDLLPVILDDKFIEDIKNTMPELPDAKRERFMQNYTLSSYDAGILSSSNEIAGFYESTLKQNNNQNPKLVANWIIVELLGALNKTEIEIQDSPVNAEKLGELINRICDNTISGKIAKQIFEEMFSTQKSADTIIEEKGLKQVTDSSAIEAMIDEVIANNPNQTEQYRSGKDKLFGFFVGQVMKVSKGKANPAQVNELLLKKLKQ